MPVQISKKRKFVQDGVFKAELNEFLTRELAEDGYSGVETALPLISLSFRPCRDPRPNHRLDRIAGARDAFSHGDYHPRDADSECVGQQRSAYS